MAIGERYDGIVEAACECIGRHGFHQASIRDIARAAGLSLAGLYHYVGGKEEMLFLVLDRSLGRLIGELDAALAGAPTPESRLSALVRTHLAFGLHHGSALKVINRDWELLTGTRRAEVAAKRQLYVDRAIAVLRALDPRERSEAELVSAANLLLGMLNGVATRPFVRSADDPDAVAAEVSRLFLHGFLGGSRPAADTRGSVGRLS